MFSRVIHIVVLSVFRLLQLANGIQVCGYMPFVYPFFYKQMFGSFSHLAIMSNVVMNIVYTFWCRHGLFGVHTWNGNAGPYGSSMFNFLRNCQTEKHGVLRVTKSQARISGFLLATQCRPEELSGSSI